MATLDPRALLRRLLEEETERPWLEFKHNNWSPEHTAKCLSACANACILAGRDRAYMVWGIADGTKQRVGTDVRLNSLKKGNEQLTNWLGRMIEPRLLMEFLDFEEDGVRFAILTIEPTYDRPVRYAGSEYVRIGEHIKAPIIPLT